MFGSSIAAETVGRCKIRSVASLLLSPCRHNQCILSVSRTTTTIFWERGV